MRRVWVPRPPGGALPRLPGLRFRPVRRMRHGIKKWFVVSTAIIAALAVIATTANIVAVTGYFLEVNAEVTDS